MMPSRGPSSQCGSGLKPKLGSEPSVRTTTLADSSGPSGTSGCGRFGTSSMRRGGSSPAGAGPAPAPPVWPPRRPRPPMEPPPPAGAAAPRALLTSVDGLDRGPGDAPATATDLDEDQHGPIERHQIDLPGSAAVVASHDGVAAGAQELPRHRLPAPSQSSPPVHRGR